MTEVALGMDPQQVALVGSLLALLGAVGAWIKARAEAKQLHVLAAAEVVQILRADVQRLSRDRDRALRRVDELETNVKDLNHRIAKLEWWILQNTEVTDLGTIYG